MTFEEFWKGNYEKQFGTCEPYYGIASYAFEKGQENCNCVHTDNSKVIERLEKKNAELKARLKYYSEQICNKECAEVWGELTEAKEIIEKLLNAFASNDFFEEEELCAMAEAEQFLKESDNEKA